MFRRVWCCLAPQEEGADALEEKVYHGVEAKCSSGKEGAGISVGKGSNLADNSSRSMAGSIPACYTLVGSGGSSSRSGACGNGCVGGGIATAATASGTATHSGSEGQASTSYLPAHQSSAVEEWDALGACMFIAQDMEEALDAVLDGSAKSAQVLLARYDMDLDQQLKKQDYYDLMLELNLSLPYEDYQALIDNTFTAGDGDRDGFLSIAEFTPLYKMVAASRRAFKRQDHHCNGQIDKYDFELLLVDLGEGRREEQQQLRDMVEEAFRMVDIRGRGSVNFGQTLLWLSHHRLKQQQIRQEQPEC